MSYRYTIRGVVYELAPGITWLECVTDDSGNIVTVRRHPPGDSVDSIAAALERGWISVAA